MAESTFNTEDHPHLRFNQLKEEWVLVSPHRTKRPWKGAIEPTETDSIRGYYPKNPLCPGNTRSSGKLTPEYTGTYTFQNDFPALLEDIPDLPSNEENDLFQCRKATGTCRVMCFHPRSDLSLPLMKVEEIQAVITEWIRQQKELSQKYQWVQIFENKGNMMGCSNPHPHCQIYATAFLPHEAEVEDRSQLKYYQKKGNCMLLDYMKLELKKKERIVAENEHWLVVVPYWALWPFEILVLPKTHVKRLDELTKEQQKALAEIMKIYLTKYDNLFMTSFPYSMGWHGAPSMSVKDDSHWLLHAHYFPPLIRSATIKKHLVGFEMLANNMRDFTPEKRAPKSRKRFDYQRAYFFFIGANLFNAADILKNLPEIHYKEAVTKEETP